LPGKAVFVLEPAALFCFGVSREFFPVVIYFFLGITVDDEGEGFVEESGELKVERDWEGDLG